MDDSMFYQQQQSQLQLYKQKLLGTFQHKPSPQPDQSVDINPTTNPTNTCILCITIDDEQQLIQVDQNTDLMSVSQQIAQKYQIQSELIYQSIVQAQQQQQKQYQSDDLIRHNADSQTVFDRLYTKALIKESKYHKQQYEKQQIQMQKYNNKQQNVDQQILKNIKNNYQYQQAVLQMQKHQFKVQKRLQEQPCYSFKPKLNQFSKQIVANKKQNIINKVNSNVGKKVENSFKQQKEDEEFQQCTFKPQIDVLSDRICLDMASRQKNVYQRLYVSNGVNKQNRYIDIVADQVSMNQSSVEQFYQRQVDYENNKKKKLQEKSQEIYLRNTGITQQNKSTNSQNKVVNSQNQNKLTSSQNNLMNSQNKPNDNQSKSAMSTGIKSNMIRNNSSKVTRNSDNYGKIRNNSNDRLNNRSEQQSSPYVSDNSKQIVSLIRSRNILKLFLQLCGINLEQDINRLDDDNHEFNIDPFLNLSKQNMNLQEVPQNVLYLIKDILFLVQDNEITMDFQCFEMLVKDCLKNAGFNEKQLIYGKQNMNQKQKDDQ